MIRHPAACLVVLGALLATTALLAQKPLTPEDAVKRMQVPDGFRARLVASEPAVRQPLSITFDGRGRMWVLQYLQYPNPAGLKAVKQDQYLRTVWDKIPDPPPKGPKGLDRVTILEDPDEAGRFRKGKDVVDGLNLASGFCLGHGGVFVVQPPYLLFYPDKDGDDKPDGDPEVLLKGFGMEDSHSYANSLQWGPDGWLYGAHGSTVSASIRGIEFQQGIWRYHPLTREFELFAEGGGNTYGLDFDRNGQVIAGTNWGGFTMLHQVQGAYYVKGFAKHGPLHNAHTYGYFDHVPFAGFKGGHVTCGGIVYEGGAYPERFRGQYIAGNLLSNSLYWHKIDAKGSTFTGKFGGDFLVSNDPSFRPVDCLTGPDGCVYVADWYDKRAAHLDPVDNWDKTTGRIYKVEYAGTRGPEPFNLDKLSGKELIALLDHPNSWFSREARRVLAERRDAKLVPELRTLVRENRGRLALESLWALYVSGGFDDTTADKLLDHADERVREWTVRFLGDPKKVSASLRKKLVALAAKEPSAVVRSQLACSAKRWPARDALPIVQALLTRDEDATDPFIPLLLWWAIEDKAVSDRVAVLGLLDSPSAWKQPLVRSMLLERIGRRYLAEGGRDDLEACGQLLASAPGRAEVDLLIAGMEKALDGRRLQSVPPALEQHLAALWRERPDDLNVIRFAVRLGSGPALERALRRAGDASTPEADRVALLELLGQTGKDDCVPVLLRVLAEAKNNALRGAALQALQPFADPRIGDAVLTAYPKLPANLRDKAQGLLAARAASSLGLLRLVDAGKIAAKDVPLDLVRRMTLHKDEAIGKLVEKHWGKVGAATPGEKLARIQTLLTLVRKTPGNAAGGKPLYQKHCATCHQLFGEGLKIGPDLTTADRKNLQYLVTHVVDPGAMIRPEYLSYIVETKDGRTLTGLLVESSPGAVTLVDAKNERTVLAREKIESMNASPVSLMPEKLLDTLDDQELRDLFAYLQGDAPR